MFATLSRRVPSDKDLPARAATLDVLTRVLDGTIYDVLPHEFHEERNNADEYVPLRERAPAVRYNLCRLVVEDSVALLFGEGRFPTVDCEDRPTRESIAELAKECGLNRLMTEAAIRGSVGSIAVLMRVLKGRVFFDVLDTRFLTPEYDPEAPDTLIRVTERRKARGGDLRASGYSIADDDVGAEFWFQREWTAAAESWFVPARVSDGMPSMLDQQRSVQHDLGFVPIVWIKNLPGGCAPDGACTFRAAIETQIEIDYQLSQAGRGLKYSSDPLLLIREPASPDMAGGQMVRSASNALVVSKDGDAKLLEIDGTAAEAVIAYVRTLRELALESIHGNRSNADRVSAAQSGRALEMLNQSLIWLADQLRVSYGESGLLLLLRMVVQASQKMPLKIAGKAARLSADKPLALRWAPWFPPTQHDKALQATTLKTQTDAGHMSRETAVKVVAPCYDIEDVPAELARIEADEAAAAQRAVSMGAQVKGALTVEE